MEAWAMTHRWDRIQQEHQKRRKHQEYAAVELGHEQLWNWDAKQCQPNESFTVGPQRRVARSATNDIASLTITNVAIHQDDSC